MFVNKGSQGARGSKGRPAILGKKELYSPRYNLDTRICVKKEGEKVDQETLKGKGEEHR